MRYRDLIQFEPIQAVIQLLDANRPEEAQKLVATYVISDEMAQRLAKVLIPQLSFDATVDHKGLLVVGNYGTGKSHLMSVMSLIAEDASYRPLVRHPQVAAAAEAIAGRFKVHRIEISSKMSLREIIIDELHPFLERQGVAFRFPPADRVVNNKAAFEDMMTAFHAVYPDQGILVVVDELLDFLRSRDDHALVLDLSFLREIGEVCKHLRFRFVAGVQEAVFDSSRFQHVADSLRRVKDRFSQVSIVRQDVSFVVAERLLKKTVDQQASIRNYLAPFTPCYDRMNERLDEYVRLFPVHPDYLDTFDRLVFAEKRGALETLRDQIQVLLDHEVPATWPGLLAYDRYWDTLSGNAALHADPAIGPVIKVAGVLTSRVQQAFPLAPYKPMAQRLIAALAVQRLATGGDIYVPIGPTPAELRDGLCLYHAATANMGGEPAHNLLMAVQTTLREILKTVNGQFLSRASGTDQYYLDLKKDIDYDAQIDTRAESLADSALDRAYFSAIRQLMERTDESTYVTGFQIWQYQIEWLERRVERTGYLFFGTPNDRPTAQPPRDFYLYFLQPFAPPRFRDQQQGDEVFFRLKGLDEDLRGHIAVYAAAQDLAALATGNAKAVYLAKADQALRDMGKWLREKQMTAIEVTYAGRTRKLQDWLKGVNLRDKAHLSQDDRVNFRDVVNVVAGLTLGQHFADLAPEYPSFPYLVTELNRKQLVITALRWLAGGPRTREAVALLDALGLLEGDRISPLASPYARQVLSLLQAKGQGQVLNRAELLSGEPGSDSEYFAPRGARLEPDLLVVVLGALVYAGHIVFTIVGDKIDASRVKLLGERSLEDLKTFRHLEAPRELNVEVLRALFELLGLAPGNAQMVAQGQEEPLRQLLEAVTAMINRVVLAGTDLKARLTFWGQVLLSDLALQDRQQQLGGLKTFLEGLTPYNTLGKLRNLRVSLDDISAQTRHLATLEQVEQWRALVADLGAQAAYLSQAELVLPPDHPWIDQAKARRQDLLAKLTGEGAPTQANAYRQSLHHLKQDYLRAYVALHGKARLGVVEGRTRTAMLKDPRLAALRTLAGIPLMHLSQLRAFEDKLDRLKSCASLVETDLAASPTCPHCGYRPVNAQGELLPAATVLQALDEELDALLDNWRQILLANLEAPVIQDHFPLLKTGHRVLVEEFLRTRRLPEPVTASFVAAVQEALSELEPVTVTAAEIRQALLSGGSPAMRDELQKRFEGYLAERCHGKDASKLRFLVE